jgi:hypothetical protein
VVTICSSRMTTGSGGLLFLGRTEYRGMNNPVSFR